MHKSKLTEKYKDNTCGWRGIPSCKRIGDLVRISCQPSVYYVVSSISINFNLSLSFVIIKALPANETHNSSDSPIVNVPEFS